MAPCGPRCSMRCPHPAGATTRCSRARTACSSATSRPTTSRPRSARWRRPTSTPAGRRRWRGSSSLQAASGPTRACCASRRSSTLTDAPAYAAIDLGASSGRVVTGRLDGDRVVLEERHRFANRPVRLPDGVRWNLLHLFSEALDGLRAAGPLRGVGVDTWGVDYALLDDDGRVLGLPFHYRDSRTDGMIERAFDRVPAEELYSVTGIQTMPINTVFQLLADTGSAAARSAARIALVPDLLALWLCGGLANERTNASTTGLLDARSGEWARDLIGRLGIPDRPFGELVEPGTELGPLLAHHELGDAPVFAVASHDTASAYVAAPVRDEHAAILSSGTWSLLGVELPEPVLGDAARE